MPIANFKPDAQTEHQPDLPVIQPTSYKGIVADDNTTPINALTAYVEGMPWAVDYYCQIINRDNDLKELDPAQKSIYQQYKKIAQLEIRVTQALNTSQDAENKLLSIQGNAVMYSCVVPNEGDTFTAMVAGGHRGIFRVSNVERKTFNLGSVYTVDYLLVAYADVDVERYRDLEMKVVQTYYFDKSRYIAGQDPLLVPEEHQNVREIEVSYDQLVKYYFRNFFSREYQTLIIPGQEKDIYDSFVTSFILKITETFDAYEIRHVRELPTENDFFLEQSQLWKVLYERDIAMLHQTNRKMGLLAASYFSSEPMLQGFRYTRIDDIVYPLQGDFSMTTGIYTQQVSPADNSLMKEVPSPIGDINFILQNNYIEEKQTTQLIYQVLSDDNYVLSEAFYNQTSGQSVLESLVSDYLNRRPLDNKKLVALAKSSLVWGRLEQFYYIPILLLLMKVSSAEAYSV
jgi:hypothetical protein